METLQKIELSIHWLDQFRSHLQTEHRKVKGGKLTQGSIRSAAQHVRVFALWYEAKFNEAFIPANLTNYDLHLYRAWSLDEEKVMARTWNVRHWALGLFCTSIGAPDLMNDIEQKEAGRASTKHRSLTDDEYHRLVHTIEQDPRRAITVAEHKNAVRNRAAVMLMLHALRVDEAAHVTAGDITINERSGNVLVRNGKGSKERNVPLHLIARQAIAAHLDLKPDSAALINLTTRSLERIVTELGQRIGVPDLTPHWLRYTCAKRLEKAGEPIESIRDILGHNSIEVTRRYLRSSMEDLQSAMDKVM